MNGVGCAPRCVRFSKICLEVHMLAGREVLAPTLLVAPCLVFDQPFCEYPVLEVYYPPFEPSFLPFQDQCLGARRLSKASSDNARCQ